MGFWTVPKIWTGETVFILGGGPSLKKFDASMLRGQGLVVALNNAGLSLAPWADILYFADSHWWRWNRARLDAFKGKWICTIAQACMNRPRIHVLNRLDRSHYWTDKPDTVAGSHSGDQALNLAMHLGGGVNGKPIVLLGYDMRPVDGAHNFHGEHQRRMPDTIYARSFLPRYAKLAPLLAARGVNVVNATPGSALTAFPMVDLCALLSSSAPSSPTVSTSSAPG